MLHFIIVAKPLIWAVTLRLLLVGNENQYMDLQRKEEEEDTHTQV
jgi:hypothetical protein